MSFGTWARKTFTRTPVRPVMRRRRLELEALEDRAVPAVVNLSATPVPDPFLLTQGSIATGIQEGTSVTITATTDTPVVGDQQVSISGLLSLLYPDLENDRPDGYLPGPQPTPGNFTLSDGGVITIQSGQTSGSIAFTSIDDAVIQVRQRATLTVSAVSSGLTPGDHDTVSFDIRDSLALSDDDLIFMRNWAFWADGASTFAWPANTGDVRGADNPAPNTFTDINWNGVTSVNGRLAIVVAAYGTLKPPAGYILPPGAETLTGLTSFDLRAGNRTPTESPFPIEQIAGFGELTQLQRFRTDGTLFDGDLTEAFPSLADFSNLTLFNMTGSGLTGTLPEFPENAGLGIRLGQNRLTGAIPAGLAGRNFDLSGNQFTGVAPEVLADLVNPHALRYNAIVGLDDGTQTVPPTDIQVTPGATPGSAVLSWTPIQFTGATGFYEVFGSQTPGGPYVSLGKTSDKLATGLTVTGLPAGMNYFTVRTTTHAHGVGTNPGYGIKYSGSPTFWLNPFDVTSVASAEASVRLGEEPSAVDVTSRTTIQRSGLTLNRATQQFHGSLTITNTGGTAIAGSLRLQLADLPSSVSLTYAAITVNGKTELLTVTTTAEGTFIHVPRTLLAQLAPGQSLKIDVRFHNPNRLVLDYLIRVFSDPAADGD